MTTTVSSHGAAHGQDPESDPEESLNIFTDPPDYYPSPPAPTTATHTLLTGQILTLSLVGHNPLWGHHLWNAGRLISTYLEKTPSLITGKTVLELGAGAGLPSVVCGLLGAKKVVSSDYPDVELVENLRRNVEGSALLDEAEGGEKKPVAEGYLWGADPLPLRSHLPEGETGGFDILILADLLFNHSEHEKLVKSIEQTLKKEKDAKALVFFTPYRPWLFQKDMAFFEVVKERGFLVAKVLEEKMERVMFEGDPGDEELRRTVFGFVVRWNL